MFKFKMLPNGNGNGNSMVMFLMHLLFFFVREGVVVLCYRQGLQLQCLVCQVHGHTTYVMNMTMSQLLTF